MHGLLASPLSEQEIHGIRGKIKRPPRACAHRRAFEEITLSGGGLRRYTRRQRHWLIGAILELDRHEDHFAVTEVFKIVHLELVLAVALVPRLARLVGVFNRGAVMHMLAAPPA